MSKIAVTTEQITTWTGDFGREYTDRNTYNPAELDDLYRKNYGITRTELNARFLTGIPRDARVLEIGCNIGMQLVMLQRLGFKNLHGIEIQSYALEIAANRIPAAVLKQGSALDIPFGDGEFDLVFTSGVLIHIAPTDLTRALREIYRCASRWIWGIEYYAPEMTEVHYRGHKNLLWKTDYAGLYLKELSDLELVREEHLKYLDSDNTDTMFLLAKL